VSLGRIFVIATECVSGWYAIASCTSSAFGILLAAAIRTPEVAATTEDKIFLDFGLAAMSLLGLIVAIFVGLGWLTKKLRSGLSLVLIAKPISRVEFITGKHLGLSAVLALLVAAMTAIYNNCTLENSLPVG